MNEEERQDWECLAVGWDPTKKNVTKAQLRSILGRHGLLTGELLNDPSVRKDALAAVAKEKLLPHLRKLYHAKSVTAVVRGKKTATGTKAKKKTKEEQALAEQAAGIIHMEPTKTIHVANENASSNAAKTATTRGRARTKEVDRKKTTNPAAIKKGKRPVRGRSSPSRSRSRSRSPQNTRTPARDRSTTVTHVLIVVVESWMKRLLLIRCHPLVTYFKVVDPTPGTRQQCSR